MTTNRDLLQAVLRNDLPSFIHQTFLATCPGDVYRRNWHIDCIAWHLMQVVSGRIKRLIVCLPPRSGKSTCVSVAFPAWWLGHDPTQRFICVSYADLLAAKHARDFRTVVESPWYRTLFPDMRLHPRKNTETEVVTTRQGFRLATSVGGTITGRGGKGIIIDDPLNTTDFGSEAERRRVIDFYEGTLYSRLDYKDEGFIILVMQRIHQHDLAGYLIDKGGFTVVSLPAIATEEERWPIADGLVHTRHPGEALHPALENLESLANTKREIGSRRFAALYQQAPVPPEGNLFKAAWFKTYDQVPAREQCRMIMQSWDTASSTKSEADYSVCTTWAIKDKQYYLLDLLRGQWAFPDLLARVKNHAAQHRPHNILIEDAGIGSGLVQQLKADTHHTVIGRRPESDKESRAAQASAEVEAGRVLLPRDAPWRADFEREVLAFPNGRHDDQVDSMTQFLGWAVEHRARINVPLVGPGSVTGPSYWIR